MAPGRESGCTDPQNMQQCCESSWSAEGHLGQSRHHRRQNSASLQAVDTPEAVDTSEAVDVCEAVDACEVAFRQNVKV